MSSEDRISRMTLAGTLTPEQADVLRQAANPAAVAAYAPHRPLPLGLITGVVVVLALGALFYTAGGDTAVATIQDVNQTINQSEGVGAMNRGASNIISFVLLGLPLVLGLLFFVSLYNGLVKEEEGVYSAWADVESTYKRRADLVPNLVSVVNTYMKHERETLTAITDQRNDVGEALKDLVSQQASANDVMAAASPDNAEAIAAVERSQSMLSQGLRGFMATVEAYPELRSADQFMALQAELEGTENRINVARMRFNTSVQDFNSSIRKMPGSLVAGMGGFQRKAYFTAAVTDEQPVEVKLGQ